MKKILITLILWVWLFWINQTFAGYDNISNTWFVVATDSEFEYRVNTPGTKNLTYFFLKNWVYKSLTFSNVKADYPDVWVLDISHYAWYDQISFYSESWMSQNFSPQINDIYYFVEDPPWDIVNTWSLAYSINAISSNTSTETNDILTWPTGILIGSLLWLMVVVIIVRRLYLVYKN